MPLTRLGNHRVGLENRLADGLDAQAATDICQVWARVLPIGHAGGLFISQRMAMPASIGVKGIVPLLDLRGGRVLDEL